MRICPSGLSAKEEQHLVGAQGQPVGGGQLRVELARQCGMGAQEAAPGAELELVQLVSAAHR